MLKYNISDLENEIIRKDDRVCSCYDKKKTHSRKEEIAKCDKSKMNTDGIGKVVSFANVSNTSTGHQDDTSA